MLLLIGLILIFTLGFNLSTFFKDSLHKWERVSLAWTIGLGLVTWELFLLTLFNFTFTTFNILGTLLVSNIILGLCLYLSGRAIFSLKPSSGFLIRDPRYFFKKLTFLEQLLVFFLLLLVVSAFIKAFYWPVYYWDAIAWYDYRGRLFADAGGIAQAKALASLPIHGMPIMTSLAHTFVYVLGGKWANPQFIYPLFYLSLITTFYFSVRKYSLRWFSILMTLLLASVPFFVEFASNAYTNLPYAFYFGMGTVYLGRFMQEREKGLLVIAAILLGLAAWTRSPTEQFFLINLVILSVWCFRQRKYYYGPVILTAFFLVFYITWKIYDLYILGLPTAIAPEIASALSAGATSPFNLGRFIDVVGLLFQSVKGVSGYSLMLAVLVTILFPSRAKKNIYIMLFWVLNFLLLVIGSYVFSLSWHDWKDSISNSANRLSMFLPPFVLYYVGISVTSFLNEAHKKK